MLKTYFTNLIARLKKDLTDAEAKRTALMQENETVDTIERAKEINKELRANMETLKKLRDEINEAEEQLASLEEDEGDEGTGDEGAEPEGRSAGAKGLGGLNPLASFGMRGAKRAGGDTDVLSTMEYRKAFMNYVQNGTKSDILKRADAEHVSEDLGVLLPNTITGEIIKGVEKVYGQLYSRVRKTNYKGGVQIPIGEFSAVMYWDGTAGDDAEHGVSEEQKAGGVTGYVQFTYHIGEIRIAQSLLQSIVTVEKFESEIIKALVEAYVKGMDDVILTGDGVKQAEGILTEAAKGAGGRIPAKNIISFTADEMADWKQWQKKLFAKIPLSMRKLRPEFVMTADTWESNIMTLEDTNGRPVYRETYNPETGDEICKFKGREVCLVEEGGFKSFDSAATGEYFGMMWVPDRAYAVNSNLQFGYKRYFDEKTNKWITKGLVIIDGKVTDGKNIYLFKKA